MNRDAGQGSPRPQVSLGGGRLSAGARRGHLASRTDVEHAYAVGKARGGKWRSRGDNAVMPAIIRTSDKPYRWKIGVAPLNKVANVEKMLPREYITSDGFGITAKAACLSCAADPGRGFSRRSRTGCRNTCGSRISRVAKEARRRFQDLIRFPDPPMSKHVDYYFTPISPFVYLGHERFLEIAARHGATIAVRAGRLRDASFRHPVGLPLKPGAPAQRQAYRLHELKRWSAHLGKPLNLTPKFFPVSADKAVEVDHSRRRKAVTQAPCHTAQMHCVWPGPCWRAGLGRGARHIR